ncbi:AGAP004546-PA-like protein [Anopheles sinensis]|uniref:AGAP004546-PA-like protein n=1 Tax=Anopheles sinensis TaxID=74873 RepID=A0A084WTV1_ANOSI|nr:AGAP004546-PA-like protein [Anopheles sinensis]
MPYIAPPIVQQQPMIPAMNQPPPSNRGGSFRSGATIGSRPQMYNNKPPPQPEPVYDGPIVTVFVGNISEKVPDPMINRYWQPAAQFPAGGARAVRLVHDLEVGGKKLVAKVDAKNKALLDSFREDENNAETTNEASEKRGDDDAMESINRILEDFREELAAAEQQQEETQAKQKKMLQTVDIEDGKRDIINKEIGKFRKYTEEEELKKEKEKERKKREEKRTEEKQRRSASPRKDKKPPAASSSSSRRRSRSRSRDRERDREREREREQREREKERERERERELRERERERERERDLERQRERERERERERDREREREREREDLKVSRNPRDIQKEKEMEEEARERKKAEKKARDKEAAYQERLRNWEARERRKAKDYEKEREKDRCKEEEREKEAKRLKEFLEDYDDDRDDPKYYKGRELQRRLAERVREADADSKDRNKEQEELDELKNKIFSGEYDNPTLEFEKAKKEREDLYKPKILIDVNLEQSQQREREMERERMREIERQRAKERERMNKERYVLAQASRELASVDAEPIDSDSSGQDNFNSPAGSAQQAISGASNGPGSGSASMTDGLGNSNHHHHHPHQSHHHAHHHHHHHHSHHGASEQRVASAGQHPAHAGSETRDSFGLMGHGGTAGGGGGSSSAMMGMMNDENSRHSSRSNSQHGVPESPEPDTNSGMNSLSDKSAHHHQHQPQPQQSTVGPTISLNLNVNAKKKKLEVKDVFNSLDDDTEESNGPKKRKLVPLEYEDGRGQTDTPTGTANSTPAGPNPKSSKGRRDEASTRESQKSQEEKRKNIKSIIDKIPTEKNDLFNYPLDWNEIDSTIEKKIRPWINKKIIEYIGEPEPTLVDFICSKVLAGSTPQGILDDVQMVLDEEAEVFVVKMWRLLIYEVEAKKVGLAK